MAIPPLVKRVARMWSRHRVSRVATALAFYAVFSIAPLTFMMLVLARTLFGHAHVLQTLEGELQPMLGNSGAHGIDLLVRASEHQLKTTPIVIVAGLVLFAAYAIFMQVQEALDDVWEVAEDERGGVWRTIALRLHVLVVVGVLALLAMAALFVALAAGHAAGFAVNLLALTVFLTVTYRVLPNVKAGWGNCALGALVTSAILLGGELLLSLYFRRFHPRPRTARSDR